MKETLEQDEYVLVYLLDTTLEAAKISNLFKEMDIYLDYIRVNSRRVKYITDKEIDLLLKHIKYKEKLRNNAHLFGWKNLVNKLNTRRKLLKKWHINKYENFYDWENL